MLPFCSLISTFFLHVTHKHQSTKSFSNTVLFHLLNIYFVFCDTSMVAIFLHTKSSLAQFREISIQCCYFMCTNRTNLILFSNFLFFCFENEIIFYLPKKQSSPVQTHETAKTENNFPNLLQNFIIEEQFLLNHKFLFCFKFFFSFFCHNIHKFPQITNLCISILLWVLWPTREKLVDVIRSKEKLYMIGISLGCCASDENSLFRISIGKSAERWCGSVWWCQCWINKYRSSVMCSLV